MVFMVMIQLCKITRASKLFQRNFYLPLLKPLSPKDALRRHIITGKNVLNRMEHYIPVLEEYQERRYRRRYMRKGVGKKRQRRKASMKYVMPFFDEDMEGHLRLMSLLSGKSPGRGQCYTYHVFDKNCTLVISHQMERALRDKDIIDIMMAQRSEKIVVVLKDRSKITLPLVVYDGNAPFYRGEGWTRKEIEETHHHGKETMTVAKLFEAKESGVEEWELEMMRMASKRKRRHRGEGTADWKAMMAAQADNIDWDKFEEDAKQMVLEQHDPVDDKPIAMEVNDMDKTKNVNEKLKNAGEEVMKLLPAMPEIPEIISIIKEEGEMVDLANVSGLKVNMKSTDLERFVPGQMVKSEDGELFVPGQTIFTEQGTEEYTPGFTVLLEGEPTLIPGLVMGDDPNKAVFLPGDSSITKTGELQFTETEDDYKVERSPPPPPPLEPEPEPEVEEVELEEEQNSEEEEIEARPPPPPKREKKEFVYERPKRQYTQSMGPKHRERKSRKTAKRLSEAAVETVSNEPVVKRKPKERNRLIWKKASEEVSIDKKRREIRMKMKKMMENKPPIPEYVPLEPVKKSEKLKELETSIKTGKFFEVDYKKYLNKERSEPFNWVEPAQYGRLFDTTAKTTYGGSNEVTRRAETKREEAEKKRMKEKIEEKILREESKVDKLRMEMRKKFRNMKFEKPKEFVPLEPVKKSPKLEELESSIKKNCVNFIFKMVNYVLSFCKITGASKIFKRNFYLPLLKPLTPKEALRTLRITGKWLLGAKVQHYIPVLLHHSEKRPENSEKFGKLPHSKLEDYTYMTPTLDPENDSHKILLKILQSKETKSFFVYAVDDKKYCIVFNSDFENAIRDGDILDVLVSQKNDKIIVKLKDRKKIPLEMQYYEEGLDDLLCGEGATTPEEEKFHHHGKYTMSLAKIFEEKEMREEKWEEELKKIMKRRKKQKWENSKAYKEMMKRNMKNLNWSKFEEEAKRVIDELSEPASECPIEMEVDDLNATKNVNETILSRGPEMLNQLPTLTEIPDLIKNMGTACLHEIEDIPANENDTARKVSGVKVVKLPSGKECFVSGQMVLTEEGEVFVPGQTIQSEFGDEYIPGITTNVGSQPTLIGGLILGEDQRDPMFLPSQSAITADGQLTFATTPEERPPPQDESERKLKRKKSRLSRKIFWKTSKSSSSKRICRISPSPMKNPRTSRVST
ncbi:LOW QUALITY PROTEIN: uncharacterized protein [Leptinotarsa decemlineata]|uniref:LOW QUALITY PROTEIN: uncharacterized protein n=1 Tax=Leptinotarsa decemlineata TaxID=7539 RepID=UPI003D309B93